MNIYFKELLNLRRSTIIWILSISAIIIFYLSIYPSFSQDVDVTKKLLSNIPINLRASLGISLDNVFTIFGFYSFIHLYILLAGSVQGMNLGISIGSKEDRDKTSDFLLTKPVKRSSILTAKIFASISSIIITNIFALSVTIITTKIVISDNYNLTTLILISLTLLFVQSFFLSLGTLISIIMLKIKSVVSISLPFVFGFFIVGMVGSIIGDDNVRYITPFKFFDNTYIINNNSYEYKFIIIEIIFIIVSTILSYIIYIKKDIRSVS